MKQARKGIFVAGAVLSAGALGCIWLLYMAFGVVTDEVDRSIGETKTVQGAAQETVDPSEKGSEQTIVTHAQAAPADGARGRRAAGDGTAAAARTGPADPAVGRAKDSNGAKSKAAQDTGGHGGREESLGDLSGVLSFFLNDGESEALNPEALLNPSNKSASADGHEGIDGLLQMIPGADSPTLQKWDEGKYRGREAQAIDDAMEDPKIWRLVFSLGGL